MIPKRLDGNGRVLFVTNYFPHDVDPVYGIFVLRQIEALRTLGWNVRVVRFIPWAPFALGRWKKYRKIPAQYSFADIPVSVRRVFLLPRWSLMQTLDAQMASFMRTQITLFKPHLIHAQGLVPAGLIAVNHGLPTLVTAHGSDAYDYPYKRRLLWRAAQKVVRYADEVVAVSSFIAAHVRALGASGVRVVYNGADSAIFYPLDRNVARLNLGLAAGRNVIVFAGHIERQKGVVELIQAVKQLRDMQPQLLIAGRGLMAETARRFLDDAGIENIFYGVLSQAELAQVLGAADIVVLPSYREGLPAIICESMLAGRAVIATSVGGIPEIVRHQETGLIVPPMQVPPLAAAIREVLGNRLLKEAMEVNARNFATERLTWAVNAASYDRIYRQLIGNNGSQCD